MMEKTQLQARIRAAFKNVPYPGDDNIGDPLGRDDAEGVTEWLRGVNWRTLSRRKDLWNLGLYFMTPEACHYYLPAYLLVALKHPYSSAVGGVTLRLRPYDGPHPYPKEIFSQFVSLLSPDQKQVIRDFLSYGRDAIVEYFLKQEEEEVAELYEKEGEAVTEESIEIYRSSCAWREIGERERTDFTALIEFWSHV